MGCGVMFGGKCGTATIMEGFWKGMFEMWLETGFLRRISCLSQWCRGGIGLSMLQQLGTGSMEWWKTGSQPQHRSGPSRSRFWFEDYLAKKNSLVLFAITGYKLSVISWMLGASEVLWESWPRALT